MKMSDPRKNISFGPIALSIASFAALLVVAFVEAATRDNVLFHQVLNTVRVTMVLFAVAMCLYVLPGDSARRSNYWIMFWTVSFISYAVHVYFSFVLFFHASIHEFFAAQGALVATTNLVVTAWWTLDFLLAWFTDSSPKWINVERTIIKLLILFLFFLSTVILHAVDNKETVVIVLGVLQALSVLVCWIVRLRAQKQTVNPASPVPTK